MARPFLIALASVLVTGGAQAQSFEASGIPLNAETLTDGLEHPWGIDFLPDGAAIVTERPGRMRIFADGALSEPVGGVPEVAAVGQGGLLDVVVARDFEDSGTIFFSYAEPGEGGAGTAIAQARLVLDGGAPRLEDIQRLFSMGRKTDAGQHFGSRIIEAPDGTLFFTIGDRGNGERAQDLSDHAGSVLRIGRDGGIPEDNPFVGRHDAAAEIWSAGHRNPQSAVFDPVTQSLWIVEHGARGGDEVNRPEAGKNYGWPVISYGRHYSGEPIGIGTEAPGYEQPAFYWDPSIAPSGMAVYDGEMFPEWQDDFLIGALRAQLVSRLERDENGAITGEEERLFEGAFGRIREVEVAPDGSIWLLTDEPNGALVRISRAE